MRVRRVLLLVIALLLLPALPAQAAASYMQVVDLTFPVGGKVSYSDSFDAARSGGRVHMAADVMAPEGAPIHAAVGGTVTTITGLTEKLPSYGYMIRIAGSDGRTYVYLHMGRNDGPPDRAYAKGLTKGDRVARGQLIGYVGCSGNAVCTAPHLHFEIHDARVIDPYQGHRLNPYPSLLAAARKGDTAKTIVHPFSDVARSVHLDAILTLTERDVMEGCEGGRFCPNRPVTRTEMAQVLARALDVPASQ
ncbi:MAG TPA: peptidoglycan DD-metalloendopeptidase family protein, partial [Euzebyales bacterium]|nr:peptidoglycan DD-metalloendopeptidase family protein [Euzebyales bacterium]